MEHRSGYRPKHSELYSVMSSVRLTENFVIHVSKFRLLGLRRSVCCLALHVTRLWLSFQKWKLTWSSRKSLTSTTTNYWVNANNLCVLGLLLWWYLYWKYWARRLGQVYIRPWTHFRATVKPCTRRAKTVLNNFLIKLFPVLIMFCTLCCHRYLQHPNITLLDVGRTHIHFLDMTVICVTVIL